MNWLELVDSYIDQKRKMGYKLISEARYLQEFAAFAQRQEASQLSVSMALSWANMAISGSDIAISRRFNILRPFSKYLVNCNLDAVILPTHYVGPTHRRLPPYIYSDDEIIELMNAASNLVPTNGLRPITMRTLIGLLTSTGIRPGEAIRLKTEDINLSNGVIRIVDSKGWNSRVVPMSNSTTSEMNGYIQQKNREKPLFQSQQFFEFDYPHSFNIRAADYAFGLLRNQLGLKNKHNHQQPRLYDFRHTFVCKRMISWYQSGINIDSHIAQLSRYLGHKKVSDTYWYLTAIPELMSCAASKFKIDNDRQEKFYD